MKYFVGCLGPLTDARESSIIYIFCLCPFLSDIDTVFVSSF